MIPRSDSTSLADIAVQRRDLTERPRSGKLKPADFANVRPWTTKLGWHVDPKRLKQFLDSFDTIHAIKFYHGTLAGDAESEQFVKDIQGFGYDLKTKPVKIMRLGSPNLLSRPYQPFQLLSSKIEP